MDTNKLPEPEVLPATGKSRFNQFKKFIPFSREKFRQLVKEGRAPQPVRMGIRCTFYDNVELHKWLADPLNYKVDLSQPSSNHPHQAA